MIFPVYFGRGNPVVGFLLQENAYKGAKIDLLQEENVVRKELQTWRIGIYLNL